MAAVVVKVTWGPERPEALSQAFTVAATALASGHEVSVWLTGEASVYATSAGPELGLEHAAPLLELRDAVLAGGTLTLCTQCALRRGLFQEDLLPGVRIAGAASFIEEATAPGATALVY